MAQEQIELFSIPSPCIGVCESNRLGYCKGCLRSREERFNWHSKPEFEQRRIIELLAKRKVRLLNQLKQRQLIAPESNDLPSFELQPDLFEQVDKLDD